MADHKIVNSIMVNIYARNQKVWLYIQSQNLWLSQAKKFTVHRIQFMLIHYQCCHVNIFDKILITEVDMASVYLPGR